MSRLRALNSIRPPRRVQHRESVLAYLRLAAPDAFTLAELVERMPGIPPEYIVVSLADENRRNVACLGGEWFALPWDEEAVA